MTSLRTALLLMFIIVPAFAQDAADGPTDPKAQKTYKEGLDNLHRRLTEIALGDFKKADKQDGGHCVACQKEMVRLGTKVGDWKVAELGAEEQIAEAKNEKVTALAHFDFGNLLLTEGANRHKDEIFARAHEDFIQSTGRFSEFTG